ncbi:hypothetical protein ACFV2H_52310 [Streptomyces sp. NPDC059629]|uniref:hypothetical protein n=1 Tax=Streptomyces sp. NPDC059629 TaxID=3346889 RepID=UPI0036941D37
MNTRAVAHRQGADPDGWAPSRYVTPRDFDPAWLDAPWSTTTLAVDAHAPWVTPREPLAGVYVLMNSGLPRAVFSSRDDALREQDRLGIPPTADSLVRMELAPAAVSGSSTRGAVQPSPAA